MIDLCNAASANASVHAFGRIRALISTIATWFSNWRSRQSLRELEVLDERALRDIGLTRADVARARMLPLDHNPTRSLETSRSNR